jgi:uncharacterized protein YidB (DUF937 family)
MGLLDVLNGMQNGPRGERQPGSGGMSPITMALLGLLAYKAVKSSGVLGGGAPATDNTGHPGSPQPNPSTTANEGGGLGGLLGSLFGGGSAGGAGQSGMGGLGGLLGGAAAGTVLSGGLGSLLKDLQSGGLDNVARSWVGTGPNQPVAPDKLQTALGPDTLDALAKQTGMRREDLLAALSQHLPGLVDHLTPNGRLPTEDEASRLV